jgi:hypothetical protein
MSPIAGKTALGTKFSPLHYLLTRNGGDPMLRGIVLWLLGVPLIVIILLYMFVFR